MPLPQSLLAAAVALIAARAAQYEGAAAAAMAVLERAAVRAARAHRALAIGDAQQAGRGGGGGGGVSPCLPCTNAAALVPAVLDVVRVCGAATADSALVIATLLACLNPGTAGAWVWRAVASGGGGGGSGGATRARVADFIRSLVLGGDGGPAGGGGGGAAARLHGLSPELGLTARLRQCAAPSYLVDALVGSGGGGASAPGAGVPPPRGALLGGVDVRGLGDSAAWLNAVLGEEPGALASLPAGFATAVLLWVEVQLARAGGRGGAHGRVGGRSGGAAEAAQLPRLFAARDAALLRLLREALGVPAAAASAPATLGRWSPDAARAAGAVLIGALSRREWYGAALRVLDAALAPLATDARCVAAPAAAPAVVAAVVAGPVPPPPGAPAGPLYSSGVPLALSLLPGASGGALAAGLGAAAASCLRRGLPRDAWEGTLALRLAAFGAGHELAPLAPHLVSFVHAAPVAAAGVFGGSAAAADVFAAAVAAAAAAEGGGGADARAAAEAAMSLLEAAALPPAYVGAPAWAAARRVHPHPAGGRSPRAAVDAVGTAAAAAGARAAHSVMHSPIAAAAAAAGARAAALAAAAAALPIRLCIPPSPPLPRVVRARPPDAGDTDMASGADDVEMHAQHCGAAAAAGGGAPPVAVPAAAGNLFAGSHDAVRLRVCGMRRRDARAAAAGVAAALARRSCDVAGAGAGGALDACLPTLHALLLAAPSGGGGPDGPPAGLCPSALGLRRPSSCDEVHAEALAAAVRTWPGAGEPTHAELDAARRLRALCDAAAALRPASRRAVAAAASALVQRGAESADALYLAGAFVL